MNTTSFMKLKNQNGEEVYSIDKVDNTVVISPVKPLINIFDSLTLCGDDKGNICDINMSEIFVNALIEAIEKQLKDNSAADNWLLYNKVIFREITDCFPDINVIYDEYVPLDGDKILN